MDIARTKEIPIKNPPSFQFYPQDFISDLNVQSMTEEEAGIYIKLLCYCWIENGLPTKGGSRVVDKWLNDHPTVARCFIEKDGKWRNPRLDKEREKQVRWREKSAIGGRHSANNKKVIKGGSTKGQPKANSSSSSSSSTSVEDFLSKKVIIEKNFKEFWDAYDFKIKKTDALKAFKKLLADGIPLGDIARAVNGYGDYLKHKEIHDRFKQSKMYPATFLREGRWKDYIGFKYEAPL